MSKNDFLKRITSYKPANSAQRRILFVVASVFFVIAAWFVSTLLLGLGAHSNNSGKQAGQGTGKEEEKGSAVSEVSESNSTIKTLTSDKDGAEMIFIPTGEFNMGTEGGYADEKPEHSVFVDGFYIYKYEVTVAQYKKFLQDPQGKGHEPDEPSGDYMPADYFTNPKYDNYPVVNVSWDDAEAYCRWAGNRLPKEAEWEKSARGTDQRTYPWGDIWDPRRVNGDDEASGFKDDGYRFTAPVGSFPDGISPYGVHDLAGNVWEWVDDWYQPYEGNPTQDVDYGTTYRILRGGSWLRYPLGLTTTSRDISKPGLRFDSIGFRCACNQR
jgi:formylglycine-generating enzyme required for sulfatase activity